MDGVARQHGVERSRLRLLSAEVLEINDLAYPSTSRHYRTNVRINASVYVGEAATVCVVEQYVQTTIRLPRALLKRARMRALTDDTTLQDLVVGGLETELERREKAEAQRSARAAKSRKPSGGDGA